MNLVMKICDIKHSFYNGKQETEVLKSINIVIEKGEFIALLGKSGSGKSTLLHLLSGFMKPTQGTIQVFDTDMVALNEKKLTLFRRKNIGFIFQAYHLIETLTVIENTAYPLELQGVNKNKRREKAIEILQSLSMDHRLDHYPHQLSGGEKQRVAIARAMITDPQIILADEPTGNLDSNTEKQILHILQELNKQKKITLIMVTHDRDIANSADRILFMRNGKLSSEENRDEVE